MSDWSQKRLIREEAADMEGDLRCNCCDSCCSWKGAGAEAGRRHQHALLPRRRETRLLRVAQLLVAGLLLLTAGSLALLFTAGLRGRCAAAQEQQVKEELNGASLDGSKHQMLKLQGGEEVEKPSAMLTAPHTRTKGNRLNWESKIGDAFCRGGFRCSDRDMVVPKKGIYRVFLQITWLQESCSLAELDLSSEVIMFSDSYPADRVVLSMVDIVSCRKYLTKSLFASRFVKLDANTTLHVNATFSHLISKDEHQVFFGAELTDSSPQ